MKEAVSFFPEITFEKTEINVGDISLDNPIMEADFQFSNTGNDTLHIILVDVLCDCMSTMLSDTLFAPGQKGVLNVRADLNGYVEGEVRKDVVLVTNCREPELQLWLTGNLVTQ